MRFRSTRKWDDITSSKGLLYFAQLIDELLFDYTIDAYKPSAMNTALLASEAYSTFKKVEEGIIMKPNLEHVTREFCSNLSRDMVAQSLLHVDVKGIINSLSKAPTSHDSFITLDLVRKQIPIHLYKKRNEEMLISEITGTQNLSAIRSLTRSYITTLLNFGYSSKYIERESQQFFFYSSDRISNGDAIREYIKIFSGTLKKYTAFYKTPEYFAEFSEAAKRLDIDIYNDSRDFTELLIDNNFELKNGQNLLRVKAIDSQDPYSAKVAADKGIELLQTLIGLYHHKEPPRLSFECLIIEENSNKPLRSTKNLHPMHKCVDLKRGPAAKRLTKFVAGFSMKRESFRKFHRSAELHALALSSDSVENQMINLWIALESLIPSKGSDKASIEHVVDSVIPFLNSSYIKKLLLSLCRDLFRWNGRFMKILLKDIEGKDLVSRLAGLLSLQKHESARKRLESSFGEFILLSERYNYIKGFLSSPDLVAEILDRHKERVSWQIRRIYRARNLIVHEGTTPTFAKVLIENIHDYLDTVVNALMTMASEGKINTIEQGFKHVELNYTAYHSALRTKGLSFDEVNFEKLLFPR